MNLIALQSHAQGMAFSLFHVAQPAEPAVIVQGQFRNERSNAERLASPGEKTAFCVQIRDAREFLLDEQWAMGSFEPLQAVRWLQAWLAERSVRVDAWVCDAYLAHALKDHENLRLLTIEAPGLTEQAVQAFEQLQKPSSCRNRQVRSRCESCCA